MKRQKFWSYASRSNLYAQQKDVSWYRQWGPGGPDGMYSPFQALDPISLTPQGVVEQPGLLKSGQPEAPWGSENLIESLGLCAELSKAVLHLIHQDICPHTTHGQDDIHSYDPESLDLSWSRDKVSESSFRTALRDFPGSETPHLLTLCKLWASSLIRKRIYDLSHWMWGPIQ